VAAAAERLNPVAFWFLRHGETDWNARNLSQGSTDVPLNAIGIAQARRAALSLAGQRIATIVSSPLGRALHTAAIAGEALRLPVAVDQGLREVAFGEQEGQPMGAWYDDWIAGTLTPRGCEPFAELRVRAVAAINRCTAWPGPVLVVAHGALWRAVRSAAGLAPNIRTPNALPLWCEPPAGPGEAAWRLTPAELAPAG